MTTNIYVAAYRTRRFDIDGTLANLTQILMEIIPSSYVPHYSLVVLGEKSESTKHELQRKILDARESTDTLVPYAHRILRRLIGYQEEFHGITKDGKQIYVFGMQMPADQSIRNDAFLELVTVVDILMETTPELVEYYSGLTLWGLGYPDNQKAEETLVYAEGYLKRNGLQTVSRTEDTVSRTEDIKF